MIEVRSHNPVSFAALHLLIVTMLATLVSIVLIVPAVLGHGQVNSA
jgi:hypothetical protein